MRSPRRVLIERLRDTGNEDRRYADCAVRLRVYQRGANGPEPGELRPRIYGGRYDTWRRRYVDTPQHVGELSCHEGQLALLEYDEPGVGRVLALGAPGGGKTEAAVTRAILCALERPNTTGGAVAPTAARKKILWDKLLSKLRPLGLLKEVRAGAAELVLVNNVKIQVVAAKKSSTAIGTPLQGYTWEWAIEDEQQNIDDEAIREVNFRGRLAGLSYVVYSTATNQAIAEFQARLDQYRTNQRRRIIRFDPYKNAFVDPAFYEAQRAEMTDEEFRRIVEGQDLPLKGLVYPAYSPANLREIPSLAIDITQRLTAETFQGRARRYIVGQDFGSRVNASIVFRVFQDPMARPGEPSELWWAVDEITTEGATASQHARALLKKYSASEIVVVADPHGQQDHNTRTDYNEFRRAGIETWGASGWGQQIQRRSRFAMVNGLLRDARVPPRTRLYIATQNGQPLCKRLVESFKTYSYDDTGKPFQDGKGSGDMSHWTDALGYALWRWERIRGGVDPNKQQREARG